MCVCVFSCALRLPPTLLSLSRSRSRSLSPAHHPRAFTALSFSHWLLSEQDCAAPQLSEETWSGDSGRSWKNGDRRQEALHFGGCCRSQYCQRLLAYHRRQGEVNHLLLFLSFFLSFFGTVFITFLCMLPRKGCFICVNDMPWVSCSGNLGLLVLFLELSFL